MFPPQCIRICCKVAVYFMLALVVDSFETGTPPMPFSPGWLVPLSMPTRVTPESEATGASPGALSSVWPGALSAPVPWAITVVSLCYSKLQIQQRSKRTLGLLLLLLLGHARATGGLSVRHCDLRVSRVVYGRLNWVGLDCVRKKMVAREKGTYMLWKDNE